jgi:peptidase M10/serralysin-like protein
VIDGFEGAGIAGGDTIDLSIVNSKLGFVMEFLGTDVAFNGNAGAIRATWVDNQTIVQLDADGDRKVDFSIALDGQHILAASDFILMEI